MKNSEEKKYRGLSVIVRNENDYKQLQKFLGQYLYIDWVPQMATTETSVIIYFDDENFMSIGSVGSAEYQKESNIRTIEFSEFFTTTQPQPAMSAEEILDDELSISMSEYLKENPIFKEWIKDAMYRYAAQLQPIEVKHQRTEQEEAARIWEDFGSAIKAINAINYTITALQLRGLSTIFEEKVLTILKGR
jgi:hypothetical protein